MGDVLSVVIQQLLYGYVVISVYLLLSLHYLLLFFISLIIYLVVAHPSLSSYYITMENVLYKTTNSRGVVVLRCSRRFSSMRPRH